MLVPVNLMPFVSGILSISVEKWLALFCRVSTSNVALAVPFSLVPADDPPWAPGLQASRSVDTLKTMDRPPMKIPRSFPLPGFVA
jgi:hypothetical protein